MAVDQPDVVGGRYRLMNRIGSGGMGSVWLAWDERLSRAVALKQLHSPIGLHDDEARAAHGRAMREARITARLHHPNAVPVFDVVDDDGRPCLVMQYLPSRSLQAVLSERSTLPVRDAARLGSEVASALTAAHEAGIVHRDVKPGNVLVAEDGSARITDFGISHAMGDASLTATGMVTGTPAYLAPEVARGEGSTPASDVFSLGATLYAATEGSPPFGTASNAMALLHRVASGAITPPADSDLAPLLVRMLAPAPADRPAMADVSRELATLATGRAALGRSDGDGPGGSGRTRVLPVAAPVTESARAAGPVAEPAAGPVASPPSAAVADAGPQDGVGGNGSPTDRDDPPPRDGTAYGSTLEAPAVGEDTDADRTHRRQTTGLLAALAVVLVAGLGFIVWALLDEPADPGGAQGGPTASSSAAPATTPSPSGSEPTTSSAKASSPSTSAPETTTTSSTAPGARGAELARAVRDYYALLPDDTDAGWARLTARYQATTSRNRETYEEFWGSVDAVAVPRSEGTAPDRVVATVRYDFDDGRRFEERTSFRLVDVGGVLKIDGSSVLSSRQL